MPRMLTYRGYLFVVLVVTGAITTAPSFQAWAGGLFNRGAVGGVSIDAEGLLSHPSTENLGELQVAWQAGLERIPA